jgi:hypothetical protein
MVANGSFRLRNFPGVNCRFLAKVWALKGSHALRIALLVSPSVESVSTSLWRWNDLARVSLEHSCELFEAKQNVFSALLALKGRCEQPVSLFDLSKAMERG